MIVIIPLIIVAGIIAWLLRPGKNPAGPRLAAILVTVLLSLIVAIVAVVFQLLHNAAGTVEVANASNTCFIVGLCLIGAYILISIGFAAAHKGDIARGAGFGTCISLVVSIIELGLLEWLGGV